MSDIFNVLVDPAAERAVLSGIFCYGEEAYLDVSDLISKPESFQIDVNQAIYQCYKHLFEKRESKNRIVIETILINIDVIKQMKAAFSLKITLVNISTAIKASGRQYDCFVVLTDVNDYSFFFRNLSSEIIEY